MALGCTGGQHRSVYFAEKLAERFRGAMHVLVRHRTPGAVVSGWLALVRPGDWLTVALGPGGGAGVPLLWRGGPAERAVIRPDGRVVAEYPLDAARRFEVAGPLGRR